MRASASPMGVVGLYQQVHQSSVGGHNVSERCAGTGRVIGLVGGHVERFVGGDTQQDAPRICGVRSAAPATVPHRRVGVAIEPEHRARRAR